MKDKLLELNIRGDARGLLTAIEGGIDVPFDIKRVFFIYATQAGVPRGKHSHYKTKQFLVAVNGNCRVTLNDGVESKVFHLNSPGVGLLQDELVWGEMHDFSEDCVLMVLASEHYDEADYIRDYDAFLKEVKDVSNSD